MLPSKLQQSILLKQIKEDFNPLCSCRSQQQTEQRLPRCRRDESSGWDDALVGPGLEDDHAEDFSEKSPTTVKTIAILLDCPLQGKKKVTPNLPECLQNWVWQISWRCSRLCSKEVRLAKSVNNRKCAEQGRKATDKSRTQLVVGTIRPPQTVSTLWSLAKLRFCATNTHPAPPHTLQVLLFLIQRGLGLGRLRLSMVLSLFLLVQRVRCFLQGLFGILLQGSDCTGELQSGGTCGSISSVQVSSKCKMWWLRSEQ
jgi:hypothetical protein